MALFIGAVGMRGSRRWIFGIGFLVFSLRYWFLALDTLTGLPGLPAGCPVRVSYYLCLLTYRPGAR